MTLGINSVTALWANAWRVACLWGWRWARAEMQKQDPLHHALPEVIRNIRRLEK